MKQTLERILNQLDHAHAENEGVVFARADRGNNGVTRQIDMVWIRGVVTLSGGTAVDSRVPHSTIELSKEEYDELKPLFPIPAFDGYSYQKSPQIALSELTSIYKRLVLDELIDEL